MIALEDMTPEDRKMCEEWEEFYKKPLRLLEDWKDKKEFEGLADPIGRHVIPRNEDNFQTAIEAGKEARRKAGIDFDINGYSFDMDANRGEPSCSIDARVFIGIPYKLGADGFDGCDCMGLARLFYTCHGWRLLRVLDGWEGTKKMFAYVRKNFKRIEEKDLSYGDLILHGKHADIFLGVSPTNDKDYVILNHSQHSNEGCSTSQIITIDKHEYMTSYNDRAEYFHRDESKKVIKYLVSLDDMEVIKINALNNPYRGRDSFFFALWRGYDIKTADAKEKETLEKYAGIDDKLLHDIERAQERERIRLYSDLKKLQDDWNNKAIKEGREPVVII